MRKIIYLSIFLFSLLIVSTSCQKESYNKELDGRWQVVEIYPAPGDVKDLQLYYNFYRSVCNLSYYGGVLTEGNIVYNDKIITLDFPYIETEEGLKKLERYGIYSNPVSFTVVSINSKSLILQDGETVITLRKF